jgi:hypothetical protein
MEYNQTSLETLLKQVHEISERYKEEERKLGDNFNFFKILGVQSKELIHSKFIAFILNINNQDENNNKFLDYFIEMLNEKIIQDKIRLSPIDQGIYKKTITERGSNINRKLISGGRVDIRIFNTEDDMNNNIIIENKINAIDQWAQLARIANTYKDKSPIIVYLTPLGKPASSYSLISEYGELKEKDYIKISYMCDIIKWIEKCLNNLQIDDCIQEKKVSVLLNEYLTVIKLLTYRERRKNDILDKLSEKLETVKLIFNKNNWKVINEITEFKDTIFLLKKYLIKEKFLDVMLNKLIENKVNGLLFKPNDNRKIMQRGWGFQFYKPEWEEYNIKIGFVFNRRHLEDCNYGFRIYTSGKEPYPEYKNRKLIKNVWYSLEPMPKKLVSGKTVDYRNWHRDLFYQFMPDYTGELTFYEYMIELIKEMCGKIDKEIEKHKT